MVIQVGINGFGRIGRIVSRVCLRNSDIQLSAINDPAISVEYICYLIKFDSTHGKMKGKIMHTDDKIIINDQQIKVFHEKLPANVPWHTAGVEYVVEASGMFTSQANASGHLASNTVKRVVVTAPSIDVPMIVLGVNDNTLALEQKVISCASSTLYCLAPIIKVLEDLSGVEEGFITSIHAMTPSLKPLDGLCLRGKHWRDHRSIHQNIIPATTGACKALGKILPDVKDKLSGLAFRVPIVDVSILDLTIRLHTPTTLQEIIKSVQRASESSLKNIITVSNEESVSSDFIGETHSCILDENSSMQLSPNFFKIICWYENEYSYACRVVDTIKLFESQVCKVEIPIKLTNITMKSSIKQTMLQHMEINKNEMALLPVCNAKTNTKTISNSSEGLKVTKNPRSLSIKKTSVTPPSLLYKETKRRTELFKIWNDTNETADHAAKQNRSAFFQSCMAFAPQPEMKIECSTKERLENVKREFSKMVNITEDLLKKTHSNQSSTRSMSVEEPDRKIVNDVNFKANKDPHKDDAKNNKISEINNVHGDNKSLQNSSKTTKISNQNYKGDVMSPKKEISDYNNRNGKIEKDFKALIEIAENEKGSNHKVTENNPKLNSETFTFETCSGITDVTTEKCKFKQHPNHSHNSLIDGLSQNIEVECVLHNNVKLPTSRKNETCDNDIILNHEENRECISAKNNSIDIPKLTTISIKNNQDAIANKVDDNKLNKEKENMKLFGEELRKRNIELEGSVVVRPDTDFGNCETEKSIIKTNDHFEDINSPKNALENMQIPSETLVEVSRCASSVNTITTVSYAGIENKQDIYDKLDSASVSDSNQSFEIQERKSQVIQITDLTNSLDDLARLDKICKIIEISDELSDKLFSALDTNKRTDMKTKKWSFKDLCERIDLDDFCNKVFGKTGV